MANLNLPGAASRYVDANGHPTQAFNGLLQQLAQALILSGQGTPGNIVILTTGPGNFVQDGGIAGGSLVTHTGPLDAHEVILGNGGHDIKMLGSLGTSGQVLTSNGVGVDPSWQASSGGTVTHTGALTLNQLVLGNGGADIKVSAATNGQVPIGKSSDGTVTLSTLTAGTGISITNGAAAITIAATGSSGDTVIGVDRSVGDGSTTAFYLADLAEYVTMVSNAGSVVDPTLYSLASARDSVVFSSAPSSSNVLTFEYVVAVS